MDRQDMWVFQGSGCSSPAFKVAQVAMFASHRVRQEFPRYLAPQLGILCQPDLAHASSSQHADELVAAQHLALPVICLMHIHESLATFQTRIVSFVSSY